MNFYSVIIGTELLNGRRTDAHFAFLNNELLKRGWEQKASFVIKDEPPFIEDIFRLVQNDPDGVMAYLPIKAGQLKNVVNNVPGFSLENRYFFTPGFPSMAHSMVVEALDKYYIKNKEKYRYFLKANCSENELIDIMKLMPDKIDFSSLPQIKDDKRSVVISVGSYDQEEAKYFFGLFEEQLKNKKIDFTLEDL